MRYSGYVEPYLTKAIVAWHSDSEHVEPNFVLGDLCLTQWTLTYVHAKQHTYAKICLDNKPKLAIYPSMNTHTEEVTTPSTHGTSIHTHVGRRKLRA